jgi:hypothetical protein
MSIDSIQARVEKATEGLWKNYGKPGGSLSTVHAHDCMVHRMARDPVVSQDTWNMHLDNASFIAHARADIPALLEVARIAKGLNECPPSPHNGWWQVLAVAIDKLEMME